MEKYLLHEKVGEGLLGEVFKAVQIETKQICAIKIIRLDQPPEDPEDVQKELNFLKTCDSQHIIKYYETILKEDTLYLVMDFVTPGSLKDYLSKVGPISETYISMILREMLLGLEYLQSERRCHRNLKASNVLLSDKGEVKLCDLVVGGSLGDATRLESVARAPYWIAPEVMSGNPKVEKLDKQDIWSIGITAYEIATGMTPYHNHEPMKMNLLLAREDPPRLEGEFSRSFKDFVNLCLSKEVKKRPIIKELLTHPFIRKSKKIYNLLDMVGKLNRQQQRLSQRVIDTSSVVGPTAAATHSHKRGRAFSASAIAGKLRSDTGSSDDGSGNELGALSFGTRTHSPSFDSGFGTGPKIGVTMSRLKGDAKYGSLGKLSSSHSSSISTTSTTSSRHSTAAPTSAFTPTPSATSFSPTTTTTTSTSANAASIKSTDTAKHAASTTPTTSTTTSSDKKPDSSLPTSSTASSTPSVTPAITVTSPMPSSTPSTTTTTSSSSAPSTTVNLPQESSGSSLNISSGLIPPPNPLISSGSNENINESDFPSFANPLSPPHTPKVKTPLLTTPPTSSFLDSVILPVLAKKGRSYTEETQGVLNELKDAFKRLEASHVGASQQLVNDWVEGVLWENYTQPERGSPMANYLLLRWKNGTPL